MASKQPSILYAIIHPLIHPLRYLIKSSPVALSFANLCDRTDLNASVGRELYPNRFRKAAHAVARKRFITEVRHHGTNNAQVTVTPQQE